MCAYICMCTYIVTVNNLIFIFILTTVHVCVRFYEGPLQISASALNGIPSLNKDYLIRFDLIKYY